MDKEIEFIISKHPSLAGWLERNHSTGCLLYKGPRKGVVEGNPLVSFRLPDGRKISMHLRKRVWTLYHPNRSKEHVRMTCNVHNCMAISHQIASRKMYKYRDVYSLYQSRLSENDIRAIRYFHKERVAVSVLCKVFLPIPYLIRIISSGKVRTDVQLPKGYHPPTDLMDRVAQESMNSPRSYLTPAMRSEAARSVRQSSLSPFQKEILQFRVNGLPLMEIVNKVEWSRNHVIVYTREAYKILRREFGLPDWLKIISHNRIAS
jgi:hypothetical protein